MARDRAVTLIDLTIAGFKLQSRAAHEKYETQFRIVDSTLKTLGINLNRLEGERLLVKYRGRTMLCCLYYDKSLNVRYAAIATFSPGALSKVKKKLESVGWRKRIVLELKSKKLART